MNTPITSADPYPCADGVWRHLRIAPGALLNEVDDSGTDDALWVRDGQLVWAGPRDALPAEALASGPIHDGRGGWLTPGWVDCHTHLVYAGQRCREFALRLSGASYEAIARAGGGILSTVAATRAASEDELFDIALPRLHTLLDDGVCAIEIKSGYGLNLEHERKMLRVARRLGQAVPVTVTTTFLGAHAIAPEWAGRPDDYIETVCKEMLPPLAGEGLVDAVDVFCDRIGFSRAQTERVFQVAASLGLPVKLHAGQFSDLGGVELASRFQALSCDHLEYLGPAGIEALLQSGTVAVLLPGAFHTLRETQRPPIEALRQAGVPMAIATDHNPGSSPALSLVLMTNLACCHFQMTVPEVLAGVTRHAARALGLQHSHGHLHIGQPAQFALWQVGHWEELPYWMGHRPLSALVSQGRIVRRA